MAKHTPSHPQEPSSSDYRLSHLAPEKGESYHAAFSQNPYRKMMWDFEKNILDDIRDTFFEGQEIHHLDFACGTGRVLAHIAARARVSVGVDISPSMLSVARSALDRSELIEADITERDVLGERSFNLITAFRFFPNAQPSLREDALRVLIKHLDRGGCLVFNNHKNLASLRYRLARRLKRGGDIGMGPQEVRDLLVQGGLEIAKTYAHGFTPAGEEHSYVPIALLRRLEKLLTKCPGMRGLGENLVYVCRRAERPSGR